MNIVFLNASPNKEGNTMRIGEKILMHQPHEVVHMCEYRISQYGNVYPDDQMKELLKQLRNASTILIGTPVYWYTVSGILKTFIDRLYLLKEAEILRGKKLYVFAQGSAPDQATKDSISFLMKRVAYLMGMQLECVIVDTEDGKDIVKQIHVL